MAQDLLNSNIKDLEDKSHQYSIILLQEQQMSQEAAYNARLISSNISDATYSAQRELIDKIKRKELEKNERTRLSLQTLKKLDKIHYAIYSEVEGCHDILNINYLNYLSDQNKQKTTFSQQHGVRYFQRLMKVVNDIKFLDKDIMKPLCNQLIGRERVIIIKYYIDCCFSAEYAGIWKKIKSYWEDFKFKVGQIIDSIKSAFIGIWKKLKSAWRYLFG